MNSMFHRIQLFLALSLLAASGLAAAQSCARVSTFDVAPRNDKLYRAVLIAVDEHTPGPAHSHSYRLTPGRHVLKVAEAIDSKQFIGAQNRERDGRRGDRYKLLEIEAEAGYTYFLAARFHLEHRNEIRTGAYWEPVIWKQREVPCG